MRQGVRFNRQKKVASVTLVTMKVSFCVQNLNE